MTPQTILVVGATGQQGGAVVKALLDLQTEFPLHILALTRNAQSEKAKALAESHKGVIELVEGDSSNPKPIFDSKPKGSIDGLFIVTTAGGKTSEERQAIPLIDTAVEHGVKHIVFTSVDRGGDDRSWQNPTNVKHFLEKHNVELHLRDKAEKESGKFTWTILRPVAFLDNFNPGKLCSMTTAAWAAALKPETKLQLVSVRDIGIFAAKALVDPAKWSGRAVGLAGDALTLKEAKAKFVKVTGKKMPQSWTIAGKLMLWGVKEIGAMFAWFEKEGYGADIEARKKDVVMQDFETWLREDSKWKD
ncbi:NmrA-like family domain-containing protein 1 [Madurella mycetomatis]|uniref:NmrA-like family domain-containing protein 1 n=1 Tax=Madurella mycetomatis TaxID=100816 RepID=A0A175VV28_9PEZI|nr:NmrA-like family domain-containing protein 1 [Madurella mycetomatis]